MPNLPHFISSLVAKRFFNLYQRSRRVINPPFRVAFTEIPTGWIEKSCWGDLTWVWRKNGISATGIAGFICGNSDSFGCSTLWNPESPNYLAWCGTYIYKPDNFSAFYHPEIGATEMARNIGYKDDITWSKMYGNKQAFYEEIHVEKLERPLISVPFQSESYFSTVRCQTYLGPKSRSFTARLASASMARLYRKTSDIMLEDRFFLPAPQLCRGHSYESILRDVWVTRVLFPEEEIIYVIYATSARSEDSTRNYSQLLQPEFERFFDGIKLLK
ncbi:MAG: hypothetical protein HZC10_08305 [Nitrospirae bacterium]|nr:hypothetical protein [Nitrospirota bacterium]